MRYLASTVILAVLVVLGITGAAVAATPGCQGIPNKACSSWETPAGGGTDLDVYRQHTTADTPLIVYTPTSSDRAEDFEVVPVPAGSVSIFTYAGSQTPTTAVYVNIEYTPGGVPSGMCISDIDPVAGQADELRPCNTVAGKYNPFQSFAEVAAQAGDGTFESFQDAPVSLEGTATGLYLSDARPDAGIGIARDRVAVVSEPEIEGALGEGQLWEAAG